MSFEAYFSVSNLLHHCVVVDEDGHRKVYVLAMRGRDLNHQVRWQALGGGAKISVESVAYLKERFGKKIRFRGGEESNDARFYVSVDNEQQAEVFAWELFAGFTSTAHGESNRLDHECTIERELREELLEVGAPLGGDVSGIKTSYTGTTSPIRWARVNSHRANNEGGYFRIFHLHDMEVAPEVFDKLRAGPNCRVLSQDDILQIYRATQKGSSVATLSDGSVIVENIFL